MTTGQAKNILSKAPHLDHCDELGLHEYRSSGSLASLPEAVLQRADCGFCDYSRSRTSLKVLGYVLRRCACLRMVTPAVG